MLLPSKALLCVPMSPRDIPIYMAVPQCTILCPCVPPGCPHLCCCSAEHCAVSLCPPQGCPWVWGEMTGQQGCRVEAELGALGSLGAH